MSPTSRIQKEVVGKPRREQGKTPVSSQQLQPLADPSMAEAAFVNDIAIWIAIPNRIQPQGLEEEQVLAASDDVCEPLAVQSLLRLNRSSTPRMVRKLCQYTVLQGRILAHAVEARVREPQPRRPLGCVLSWC